MFYVIKPPHLLFFTTLVDPIVVSSLTETTPPFSPGDCADQIASCEEFKAFAMCNSVTYKPAMDVYCPATCGTCETTSTLQPQSTTPLVYHIVIIDQSSTSSPPLLTTTCVDLTAKGLGMTINGADATCESMADKGFCKLLEIRDILVDQADVRLYAANILAVNCRKTCRLCVSSAPTMISSSPPTTMSLSTSPSLSPLLTAKKPSCAEDLTTTCFADSLTYGLCCNKNTIYYSLCQTTCCNVSCTSDGKVVDDAEKVDEISGDGDQLNPPVFGTLSASTLFPTFSPTIRPSNVVCSGEADPEYCATIGVASCTMSLSSKDVCPVLCGGCENPEQIRSTTTVTSSQSKANPTHRSFTSIDSPLLHTQTSTSIETPASSQTVSLTHTTDVVPLATTASSLILSHSSTATTVDLQAPELMLTVVVESVMVPAHDAAHYLTLMPSVSSVDVYFANDTHAMASLVPTAVLDFELVHAKVTTCQLRITDGNVEVVASTQTSGDTWLVVRLKRSNVSQQVKISVVKAQSLIVTTTPFPSYMNSEFTARHDLHPIGNSSSSFTQVVAHARVVLSNGQAVLTHDRAPIEFRLPSQQTSFRLDRLLQSSVVSFVGKPSEYASTTLAAYANEFPSLISAPAVVEYSPTPLLVVKLYNFSIDHNANVHLGVALSDGSQLLTLFDGRHELYPGLIMFELPLTSTFDYKHLRQSLGTHTSRAVDVRAVFVTSSTGGNLEINTQVITNAVAEIGQVDLGQQIGVALPAVTTQFAEFLVPVWVNVGAKSMEALQIEITYNSLALQALAFERNPDGWIGETLSTIDDPISTVMLGGFTSKSPAPPATSTPVSASGVTGMRYMGSVCFKLLTSRPQVIVFHASVQVMLNARGRNIGALVEQNNETESTTESHTPQKLVIPTTVSMKVGGSVSAGDSNLDVNTGDDITGRFRHDAVPFETRCDSEQHSLVSLDINQDCKLDITDVWFTRRYILHHALLTQIPYATLMDANSDGVVDAGDVLYMARIVFRKARYVSKTMVSTSRSDSEGAQNNVFGFTNDCLISITASLSVVNMNFAISATNTAVFFVVERITAPNVQSRKTLSNTKSNPRVVSASFSGGVYQATPKDDGEFTTSLRLGDTWANLGVSIVVVTFDSLGNTEHDRASMLGGSECRDVPSFKDVHGNTCVTYTLVGWCVGGTTPVVKPNITLLNLFANREGVTALNACCACGYQSPTEPTTYVQISGGASPLDYNCKFRRTRQFIATRVRNVSTSKCGLSIQDRVRVLVSLPDANETEANRPLTSQDSK